jgi:diadenylate cyclase
MNWGDWTNWAWQRVLANWTTPLEILLLAGMFYYLLLLFRGTRGAAVFMGLVVALFVVGAITRLFQFQVISVLMDKFLAFLAFGLLVIFQPELRRLLAELGSQYFMGGSRERGQLIDVLVDTAKSLSQKKCGALMAIEREVGFPGIAKRGVPIEATATPELLATIFFPNTPLHDGGVILRNDKVIAAACIFPLTQRDSISPSVGTRHRAAIGITEESDAVAVVVSEETGEISVAHRGHLVKDLDADGLRAFLSTTLLSPNRPQNATSRLMRKLFEPLPLLSPLRRGHTNADPTGFSNGTDVDTSIAPDAPSSPSTDSSTHPSRKATP